MPQKQVHACMAKNAVQHSTSLRSPAGAPTWQQTAVVSGFGSGCPSSQSSGAAPAMLLGHACAALSSASASRTSAYTARLLYFEASRRLSVTSAACWTQVLGSRLNPAAAAGADMPAVLACWAVRVLLLARMRWGGPCLVCWGVSATVWLADPEALALQHMLATGAKCIGQSLVNTHPACVCALTRPLRQVAAAAAASRTQHRRLMPVKTTGV